MKRLGLIVLLISILFGCSHDEKELCIKHNIVLSITNGSGLSIPVFDNMPNIFSDSICENKEVIYCFNIDTNRRFTVIKGLGVENKEFGLKLSDTLEVKSQILKDRDYDFIVDLSNRIYNDWDSFKEKDWIRDLWLCNLTLDKKEYVYYLGQETFEGDTLSSAFNQIVDKCVSLSSLKIDDYK